MFGIRVGPMGNSLQVTHLFFANDTLVLCDADLRQILFLQLVLFWFEVIFGLKINMGKSKLVPMGVVQNIVDMVDVLGCRQGSFPLKYLGLPLGGNVRDSSIWNPIIEKMERRLAGWKRLYLSKGGKVTLIKSTLLNLPTYFLSLFPISVEVANHIEQLQKKFLYSGMGDVKKTHLVKWAIVCALHSGGLSIRSLRSFNKSLFGKLLWRFGNERQALWTRVIGAKYGCERGGWCSLLVTGSHGVSLWKSISHGWPSFVRHNQFEVGARFTLRFW